VEAARAAIEWATDDLRLDVNGATDPDNAAAIALMRRLGMEDDGIQILQSSRRGSVQARVFKARYPR
jgi:RimJ/RimL family protein N-acetyltransferase